MQMQHFNHNIWEKHIFSVPSYNSKAAILIFPEALQKLSSLGGSFRQEVQPCSNLLSWKTPEQMQGMELEILTTVHSLTRTVTRKYLWDSSISDFKIMIIYYLGFSLTEHTWKSYSRSVWVSLFLHLLPCSLCLKMLCDEISLLQTQFRATQTELLPDGSDLSLSPLFLLKHQYIRGSGSSGDGVLPAAPVWGARGL